MLIPVSVAAVFYLAAAGRWQLPADAQLREVHNNPDKFYLCATNSAYDYHFTYDPRAADEWLFHTGGPLSANR